MAMVCTTLVELGRMLLAALASPIGSNEDLGITGRRATFSQAPALLTGFPTAQVNPGCYLAPVVNGELRPEILFKTMPNPDSDNGAWTVPDDGPVLFKANVGGARHNLPAGTLLRWDPPIAGVAETLTLAGPATGGVDAAGVVGVKSAVTFETLPALTSVDLFRTKIGPFPAALLWWDSSEPASGMATSTQERGRTRNGQGSQLYQENFSILFIATRQESELARRAQGIRLMQAATGLFTDRQTVDGVVISQPSGIMIKSRHMNDSLPREVYRDYQAYQIDLAVVGNFYRDDAREYANLLRFQVDVDKREPAEDLRIVSDMEMEVEQDG